MGNKKKFDWKQWTHFLCGFFGKFCLFNCVIIIWSTEEKRNISGDLQMQSLLRSFQVQFMVFWQGRLVRNIWIIVRRLNKFVCFFDHEKIHPKDFLILLFENLLFDQVGFLSFSYT